MVRIEGEMKSIKEANLKIPPPPGWTENFDPSTGKYFYTNGGQVSWNHPLVGKKRSHEEDQEDEIRDSETGFSRSEFLMNEEKRLKLNRRKKGIDPDDVSCRLIELRKIMLGGDLTEILFTGTPQVLVSVIESTDADMVERNKHLIAGLFILLEDYRKLRFNKIQLTALMDKIEDLFESVGEHTFSPSIIEWIIGGLKLAVPISYSV
jgi:hypothetical protein